MTTKLKALPKPFFDMSYFPDYQEPKGPIRLIIPKGLKPRGGAVARAKPISGRVKRAKSRHERRTLTELTRPSEDVRFENIALDSIHVSRELQALRPEDDPLQQDLTASIKATGRLLQPVMVRPAKNGRYDLVFGQRRLRAALKLGWQVIPAIITDSPDNEAFGLIESNLQRQSLDPVAEAKALARLKESNRFSDAQLGKMLGLSRTAITQRLGITRLPPAILNEVSLCKPSRDHLIELSQRPEEEQPAVMEKIKGGATRAEIRETKEKKPRQASNPSKVLATSTKAATTILKGLDAIAPQQLNETSLQQLSDLKPPLKKALKRIEAIEAGMSDE